MRSYRRIFFFILACLLFARIPANTVCASAADTQVEAAATDSAQTEAEASTVDGVFLAVFLSAVLFICVVAVIVAVNAVTVSLPVIEFFE